MKKIFIGMAILSAGLFTSCSDFLTEEPKQEQSNELTFATFDGVNKAAAAMYGMFQSDAWYDGEAWTYNESFRIGEFSTRAENVKRAFCRALHGLGVVFYRGRVVVVDDGDCLEIQNRKSGEPLFVAIPMD